MKNLLNNAAMQQVVKASITTETNKGFYQTNRSNEHVSFIMKNLYKLCMMLLLLSMITNLSYAAGDATWLKGGKCHKKFDELPGNPAGGPYKYSAKFVNDTQHPMHDIRIMADNQEILEYKVIYYNSQPQTGQTNAKEIHIKLDNEIPSPEQFEIELTMKYHNGFVTIIPTDSLGADLMINPDENKNIGSGGSNNGKANPPKPTPLKGGKQTIKFHAVGISGQDIKSSFPSLDYKNETGQDICDMHIEGIEPTDTIDSVFVNGQAVYPISPPDPASGISTAHVYFPCVKDGEVVQITVKFKHDQTSYKLLPTNKDSADIVTGIQDFANTNANAKDKVNKIKYPITKAKKISSAFKNNTNQPVCDLEISAEKNVEKIIVDGVEWPITPAGPAKKVKADAPADKCVAAGSTVSVTIIYEDGTTDTKSYTIGVTDINHKTIYVANCTGGMKTLYLPNRNSVFGLPGRSGSVVAINESCSPISQIIFTSPDPGVYVTNASSTLTSTFNNTSKILTFSAPVLTGDTINYSFVINHLLPYSPTDTFPYTTIELFYPGSEPFDGWWMSSKPTCPAASNGKIDFTVSEGIGPISFLWSNSATTEDLENITAGTYTVTVTSSSGCMVKKIVLEADEPKLEIIPVNAWCNGSNDGEAIARMEGLIIPIQFTWSNGCTTQNNINLNSGIYTLAVTDSVGCTLAGTVNITQHDPVVITGSVNNLPCNNDKGGSINLIAIGGTGFYNYLWNNGMTVENRTKLGAGIYTVIATDGFGCSGLASFIVTQPAQISIAIAKKKITCGGTATGKATASITGGTPPYSLSWSNGSNINPVTNLTAGTYTVVVTDANGCTKTKSAVITENLPLSATVNIVGPAEAIGAAIGGVPDYTFSWNTIPVQTSQMATGLLPGQTYTLIVTDSKLCSYTVSFVMGSAKLYDDNQGDINSFDVTAYPNPTSGMLSIEIANANAENCAIELFDVTGRKIYSSTEVNNSDRQTQHDFSSYTDGIYLLKVSSDNKVKVVKVILRKD